MHDISVRDADVADAAAISALVSELGQQFIVTDFSEEGRETLLASMRVDKVAGYLEGDFSFQVAEHQGRVIGVVALRGDSHLYYLFVAAPFQGQGIARRLWEQAKARSIARGVQTFTVNASAYAVPAYERLGFEQVGPPDEKNGVISVPMQMEVTAGKSE